MSKLDDLIKQYCPDGVGYKRLDSFIRNGRDYKSFPAGDVPVYGSGGIMTYINTYAYDKPSVLIPRKGSLGNILYVDSWYHDLFCRLHYTMEGLLLATLFLFYISNYINSKHTVMAIK